MDYLRESRRDRYRAFAGLSEASFSTFARERSVWPSDVGQSDCVKDQRRGGRLVIQTRRLARHLNRSQNLTPGGPRQSGFPPVHIPFSEYSVGVLA